MVQYVGTFVCTFIGLQLLFMFILVHCIVDNDITLDAPVVNVIITLTLVLLLKSRVQQHQVTPDYNAAVLILKSVLDSSVRIYVDQRVFI